MVVVSLKAKWNLGLLNEDRRNKILPEIKLVTFRLVVPCLNQLIAESELRMMGAVTGEYGDAIGQPGDFSPICKQLSRKVETIIL